MKGLVAAVFLVLAGCVHPVFNRPMTVSTHSNAAPQARRLQQVRVERCASVFLFIPIPFDPRQVYDDLLDEAQRVGGNAIVDFQWRGTGVLGFPGFIHACVEGVGTAAVL